VMACAGELYVDKEKEIEVEKMKMGIWMLFPGYKSLSWTITTNVYSPDGIPCSIGITIEDQTEKPCEKSCPRKAQFEFLSELAHFDRGGSSQGHSAKCGGLIALIIDDLVADDLEEPCNWASKPHDIKPRIVNATIIDDYEVYPNHKCKFTYCIADTVCRNYEGHQVTIPGEALVKCSGGDLDV